MPFPKNRRRGGEETKSKGSWLLEKASSFHDRGDGSAAEMFTRLRTGPDLLIRMRSAEDAPPLPRLTKLLVHVTIQRSLGAVRVILPMDATVEDLITAALQQYAKEARVPVLPCTDPSGFRLHYSQFSLESLHKEEKLISLGSRNFFLFCPTAAAEGGGGSGNAASAGDDGRQRIPCLRFINIFM